MVNIDTVYQKVLVLANKEQRGYITPQEFNLMADKAQLEIFENHFHDLKTAYHKVKNENSYSDEIDIILEKLQFFKQEGDNNSTFTLTDTTSQFDLRNLNPSIYRLDTVSAHEVGDDNTTIINHRELMELNRKEFIQAQKNPLTKPTSDRPVFVREGGNIIKIDPSLNANSKISFHYWKKPTPPKWAYVIVNSTPLYNFTLSVNFELHPSEEENLVTRILMLSGVIIKNMDLVQSAMADQQNTFKQQND